MLPGDILTSNIIEETLRNDQGGKAKLISYTYEDCDPEGLNFFNSTKRIKVIYVKEGNPSETHYVAKLNPCRPADAYNHYRKRAIMKEVFFYKDLLPVLNVELEKMGDVGLKVPKYFYSSLEEGKEVLIIEDLSLRGFKIAPGTVHGLDDAHTILLAKEISRLHAASDSLQNTLQVDDLCKVYPLLVESWHVDDPKLRVAFESTFKKGMIRNITLTKALGKFEELLPWMEKMKNNEMKTICDELLSTPPWQQICHGDYHRGNIMFRYNESNIPEDIMVFDWQTVRVTNPCSEIDYTMHSTYMGPTKDSACISLTKIYFENYFHLRGPETFFTLEDLRKELKKRHFGLLLCFCMVPVVYSGDNLTDAFNMADDEESQFDSITIQKAKELFESKPLLLNMMEYYLKEIYTSDLWRKEKL